MAARQKPAPKRGASRYQAPANKPVPGWAWLACGLVIGGFFMFLFSLEPGRDEVRRNKPEQARQAPKAQAQSSAPSARPEPVKPKYDFYTLLPESPVSSPKVDEPPPPATVSAEEAARIDQARAEAALRGEVPPPPPQVASAQTASTPPAAQPGSRFFLQAGSFRKREEADRMRAQLILLGQSVQIESGKVREETWHRVLIGPYASREQLASAQKALAADGFGNLLLQQR